MEDISSEFPGTKQRTRVQQRRHVSESSAVANENRSSARMTRADQSLTSHPVGYYQNLLCGLTNRIEIWTTQYQHVLNTHDEILHWHRGTGLRPYLDILSADEREAFEKTGFASIPACFSHNRRRQRAVSVSTAVLYRRAFQGAAVTIA